jgi:hypothetical protein
MISPRVPNGIGSQATSPSPRFRLTCPAGCTAGRRRVSGPGCQATLRRDLSLAVRLALRAADRLESVPRDERTACLYRVVFGHAPGRRVPFATRFPDAGTLTAQRFRRVAAALERRGLHFECRAQPAAHPNRNAAVPRAIDGRPNRKVVWLYPRYWSRTRPVRLGVLVHETLHLVYPMGDQGTAPQRDLNAHCYEWLVLGLNGLGGEPSDLCYCRVTPP